MTDIKQYIAQKAEGIVNGARRGAYGTPESNFHRIAIMWQAWLDARGLSIVETQHAEKFYDGFSPIRMDASWVSPMMRLMKEARLVETPNHLDSFIDLVGYALTGAEVNQVQVPNDTPLTQDEMDAFRRKFGDLLAEKDKQIAVLTQQLQDALRATTELRPASAHQDDASSEAPTEALVMRPRTAP